MKQKLEMTQVGDISAAMRKWESVFKNNPDIKRCKDLETLGGTVFAFAHLAATRQVIGTAFCDEKAAQKIKITEMADILRNKHVCTFYIWSLNDESISFETHFVFTKNRTKVECMVCADHTTGMIGILSDFKMLPAVLSKLMKIENTLPESADNISEN